jgi:2-enoate reductase
MMTKDLMNYFKVTGLTGCRLSEVVESGVRVTGSDGKESTIEADTVVMAVGMKSDTVLFESLKNGSYRTFKIGDCRQPKNVMNAVWDAYEVARFI